MPDEKKPDEGKTPASAGGAGQSTPPASEQESQPLPEWAKAILKRLDDTEKLAKGVQKGTDKQIKNQVNSSIDRILELAGEGKSKAQIERELWIDSLMQGKEGDDDGATSDKSSKSNSPDIVKVIDEVFAFPENDSRVTDLKLKHGNDVAAYLREGLKLAETLGAQDESTPAEQPIPKGGAVQKDDNPISNINDSKTLYRLAAQKMAKESAGRRATSKG